MFEWLEEELDRIMTPKFHVVDGPASAELRQAVERSDFPFPPSYREFVLRFGNSKFYRYSTNYYITIFAGPKEAATPNSERYLQIGRTWISNAFFKESLLRPCQESPVFESFSDGIRQTGESFNEWLKSKSAVARKRFSKKQWDAIEKGPAPFTDDERAIVDARKLFRWRIVGIAPNEDLRFEIHNGSTMTLPYLSVGVRGKLRSPKTGPLNGGGYLPVSSIRPGETKLVEYDCYKRYIAPEDTEVFELLDPGPEDREQYWEFRSLRAIVSR
jgi:hypothetical protein